MNRNSHNLRGSSVNPAPRWRSVFIALVIVLAIGSVGQTSTAQAAPTREPAYFSMEVQNPKTTLRCGQTVTYLVVVDVAPSHGMPTPAPATLGFTRGISVIGIKVEAGSVNKSVGDFVGTATARTSVFFDDDLTTGLPAKFKFKANKPGKTTLYFEGLVGNEYVSAQLDVKVLPCKFKVKTIIKQNAVAFDYLNVTMTTDEALMTADAAGSFTGSTTLHYTYSGFHAACGDLSASATDSQVTLTGKLDEDGQQFTATETFGPTTITEVLTARCGVQSASNTHQATLDPLTFTVASSGGVVGIGTARIIVIPEEDEAVSFIPGQHWADWGVFLSLFGALLDLH